MELSVDIGESETGRLWASALAPLVLRHPNPATVALVALSGGEPPMLTLSVRDVLDTSTGKPHERNPMLVSQVRLTYFPGDHLARMWMCAAWVGYLQHEALELATVNGRAVLDPHADPYEENAYNRCLRDGLPRELTPETLKRALRVVMEVG